MGSTHSRVQAFVRVKPTAHFAQDMIKLGSDNKSINIYIRRSPRGGAVNNSHTDWSFKLDGLLHNTSQKMVYETVAKDLVAKALQGYNGTIMCYGQTGAGKTYTMTGVTSDYRRRGIIPRAIHQIFKAAAEFLNVMVTVRISYLEIYNEALFDLLAPELARGCRDTQLVVRDGPQGVYVKGLSIHPVSHEEEALHLLFEGETNRVIGEHTLNKNSSRSHCIFTLYIECRSRDYTNPKCLKSKITLIDLAGSERLSKTGSEGQLRVEASYINKSLSFLEQLVIALADPKREHIPFRQSKLTHVLKDSLGGNCNTVLVTNIYGEASHVEETANHSFISYKPLTAAQREEIRSQVQKYLRGVIKEIDVSGEKRTEILIPPHFPPREEQSPSSKEEAFELFKKEAGREIHQIFRENNRILISRKKRSCSVANRINHNKQQMEGITEALEAWKRKQSQEGKMIIKEKELSLILKLKELKEAHRAGFAELQDLKAEIQYCQQLVDKCRKRLISEFEIWYKESFLIPEHVREALKPGGNTRAGMIPINRVTCLDEDEQDRFEQMQEMVLPESPGSEPFYRARMKTEQKHTFNRTMAALQKMSRKPGLVTAAGKKKALSFLPIT
uniref:Kinesin-like protein n=1 Tax=Corvus moneduloides TaxID=1196302 RepID=A0A8U7MF09_CORMO